MFLVLDIIGVVRRHFGSQQLLHVPAVRVHQFLAQRFFRDIIDDEYVFDRIDEMARQAIELCEAGVANAND